MAKYFKCPFCDVKMTDKEKLYYHIETVHNDLLKDGYSGARVYFNYMNKKEHGTCVICKKPTEWNESTRKYMRFCSNECKEEYVKQMKSRMLNVYGKVHLLNDPKKQREMLQARSISGEYQFSDGGKVGYTGSYERSFLEFLDKVMEFKSVDVISPCPITFYYTYEGKELFYIPDVYIPSLNLIVEIKDGGDNPNTHHKIQEVDKAKEKLKDDLMKKGNYNYLKITNKNNEEFIQFLIELKDRENDKPLIKINENLHYIGYLIDESISEFPISSLYFKHPLDNFGYRLSEETGKLIKVKLNKNGTGIWSLYKLGNDEIKTNSELLESAIDDCSLYNTKFIKREFYISDTTKHIALMDMQNNSKNILKEVTDTVLLENYNEYDNSHMKIDNKDTFYDNDEESYYKHDEETGLATSKFKNNLSPFEKIFYDYFNPVIKILLKHEDSVS